MCFFPKFFFHLLGLCLPSFIQIIRLTRVYCIKMLTNLCLVVELLHHCFVMYFLL
jgi:hypothetical protein